MRNHLYRVGVPCIDLERTDDELLAFNAIPVPKRTYRLGVHDSKTVDAYVKLICTYIIWMRGRGEQPFPATGEAIVAFLTDLLAQGRSLPMVLRHVTAINAHHRAHGLPNVAYPQLGNLIVRLRKAHHGRQATPLSYDALHALHDVARLREPTRAMRDTALLLFAFASAMRPSEIANVQIEDLCFEYDGVVVFIPKSKGDRKGDGQFVTIVRNPHSDYCPVHALERWIARTGRKSGPVFTGITRYGTLKDRGVSTTCLQNTIRNYTDKLRLPGRYTMYSMRRGFATEADKMGVPEWKTQKHLRHEHWQTTKGYTASVPTPFSQSITAVVMP